jgi:hypothetical protein
MKSRYFQYAVYSSGMMLAGHFTFKSSVGVEHATKCAAWEAQIIASDSGASFDYEDPGSSACGCQENQGLAKQILEQQNGLHDGWRRHIPIVIVNRSKALGVCKLILKDYKRPRACSAISVAVPAQQIGDSCFNVAHD